MSEHHCVLDGPDDPLGRAAAAGTEAARRRPPEPDGGWSNWEANNYLLQTYADERNAFLEAYRAEHARIHEDAET